MLNKEQIMEILPHRPPMLLVDEILEMDEEHAVGTLHLTGDEFFFRATSGQPDHARRVPAGGAGAGRRRGAAVHSGIQGEDRGIPVLIRRNSAPWPSRAIRSGWR